MQTNSEKMLSMKDMDKANFEERFLKGMEEMTEEDHMKQGYGLSLIETMIANLHVVNEESIMLVDKNSLEHTIALFKRIHELYNDENLVFCRRLLYAVSWMKKTIMKEVGYDFDLTD